MKWFGRSGYIGAAQSMDREDSTRAAQQGQGGWRVLGADELYSLVDPACGSPASDTTVFSDIQADPEGVTGIIGHARVHQGAQTLEITPSVFRALRVMSRRARK